MPIVGRFCREPGGFGQIPTVNEGIAGRYVRESLTGHFAEGERHHLAQCSVGTKRAAAGGRCVIGGGTSPPWRDRRTPHSRFLKSAVLNDGSLRRWVPSIM